MRLKIAIVTQAYHPSVGGVTEHVEATANGLRARGHRVTIITSGPRRRAEEPGVWRIGRNWTVPYNGADNNITAGFGLGGALRRHLASEGYDVVHVHCPLSPTLPLLTLRAACQPVVGTFHTVSASDLPFRIFGNILRPFYRRLTRVIAVSEAARADVLRNFPGPIVVVPNGVDLGRFKPGLTPLQRYDDAIPNLLYVGRFDPRKGLPELLLACERLQAEGLSFRLILVGDGRLRRRIERIADGPLRGRVHFEGRVPHARLPRYYATADVFCSPARGSESFGLVLLEAMAVGAPVVATDLAGYRSVLTPGAEGLLVPPRDPAALAEALGALLRDPERRARMGARGVQTAARFGWDRVTQQLESIYQGVLGPESNSGSDRIPATAAPTPARV